MLHIKIASTSPNCSGEKAIDGRVVILDGGGGGGAIILISDTLYHPYTHCHKFSSRYSIRLPSYGWYKNSL